MPPSPLAPAGSGGAPRRHLSRSLVSPEILAMLEAVRAERWGGGGIWQMVQGHGKPAQCWKPLPSCRAGGVEGVLSREWGGRMVPMAGREAGRDEEVLAEDKAVPRMGCTWCTVPAAWGGCPAECPTVPQWKAEWCPP